MIGSNSSLNSSRVRRVAARVIDQTFDYRRVGFDHRPVTLLNNGLVGRGAAERELSWRLQEWRGTITLEFHSNSGLTCRLTEGRDKVWRGNWVVCEKMPVELVPLRKSSRGWKMTANPRNVQPPSLFIVSLPRSLSTRVYHAVCGAVGLNQPRWTSDGEILNFDRFCLYPGPNDDTSRKFISPALEPELFHAVQEFLGHVAEPASYAYKDVVQPFVVAQWLRDSGMQAIHIRRNIADIAYSMLELNWYYPAKLFPKIEDQVLALVLGLAQAERALDALPVEHIAFDEMIRDERIIDAALKRLFGRAAVRPVKFIDARFKGVRARVLNRRKTRKYQRLLEYAKQAESHHQSVKVPP